MSISRMVHFSLHKLKIVVLLIFPLADYCCLVYNDLTGELNANVERLMNCGVGFEFNLRQDEHITPYKGRLGWLTVKSCGL